MMDGWMQACMDRMDGCDGWMDGWKMDRVMDGWM